MAAAGLITDPELAPVEESLICDWLWTKKKAPLFGVNHG